MLNRSASLAMSTSVFKALPGKLDIKRHSPSILYISSEKERILDNFFISYQNNVVGAGHIDSLDSCACR